MKDKLPLWLLWVILLLVIFGLYKIWTLPEGRVVVLTPADRSEETVEVLVPAVCEESIDENGDLVSNCTITFKPDTVILKPGGG